MGWAIDPSSGVLIRRGKGTQTLIDTQGYTRGGCVKVRAEAGVLLLQAKWQGLLATTRTRRSRLPRPFEGP